MNENNLVNLGLPVALFQEADGAILGRVSVQHKGSYKVITSDGERQAQISGKLMYKIQMLDEYPAVGDWVVLNQESDAFGPVMIQAILPRRSVLTRKVAGNRCDEQILASNVDTIFLCMALNEDFNIRRLERYLAIANQSDAKPVILLTKSDLCDNLDHKVADVEAISCGVQIFVISSIDFSGYEDVLSYMNTGKTVAFIGSSGVGKSTMINHLIGESLFKTNGLRHDGLGRHTTTHRQLVEIPNRGCIIDTPGMKELGLVQADLDSTFEDIEVLSNQCKFSNCTHKSEPGCAVKLAIRNGELDEERFSSYKKLNRELAYQEQKAKHIERKKQKSHRKLKY